MRGCGGSSAVLLLISSILSSPSSVLQAFMLRPHRPLARGRNVPVQGESAFFCENPRNRRHAFQTTRVPVEGLASGTTVVIPRLGTPIQPANSSQTSHCVGDRIVLG